MPTLMIAFISGVIVASLYGYNERFCVIISLHFIKFISRETSKNPLFVLFTFTFHVAMLNNISEILKPLHFLFEVLKGFAFNVNMLLMEQNDIICKVNFFFFYTNIDHFYTSLCFVHQSRFHFCL